MSNPTRIERIAHAAASPEGENSTYVLPDSGLVVDPGPPGDQSWETLTAGLSAAGLSIDAVETVAVTHWHADHAGLAPRLATAADAELAAHEADAPLVADYAAERERRLDRDTRRLREWGAPEAVVTEVVGGDTPSPMPDRCSVTTVGDGDVVAGLEAVHTPGHTAGHLALDAGDALLVGDAVLPTYTPNVGGSDTRVGSALSTYLDTIDDLLDRFGEASATETDAYPGHGSTVDLSARIQTIRRHHAERIRDAVAALPAPDVDSVASNSDDATHPGQTPWAVAVDLFGEMRGIHAKMGAGEAAAHLASAADSGFAERVAEDPDRYIRRATDCGPDLASDGL
jgi:glyoxylase-like metal-dependent hydrolase (beta-lactamase superfamily II)